MTAALIAEHEMRRLLCSYARAADRLDRDLLATLFHDDAKIDLGAISHGSPAGFVDVTMDFMGRMAATRHDIGNVLVRLDGQGTASAETYVQAWHRIESPVGTHELTVYGRYLTAIEERAGCWAIVRHTEVLDFARKNPVDPSWFDGNTEMPKGRRNVDDASYAFLA